jgi:hypothetical protein
MTNREESFKIVNSESPLEGKDEHKLEYIKAVMSLAMDDIQHITRLVTVSLAIILIFLTQIPIDLVLSLRLPIRIFLCIGLGCSAFSGLFFFRYTERLHTTRMTIARCLPSLDVRKVRELWAGEAGVWQQHRWNYNLGRYFLTAGIGCIGLTIVYIFLNT